MNTMDSLSFWIMRSCYWTLGVHVTSHYNKSTRLNFHIEEL